MTGETAPATSAPAPAATPAPQQSGPPSRPAFVDRPELGDGPEREAHFALGVHSDAPGASEKYTAFLKGRAGAPPPAPKTYNQPSNSLPQLEARKAEIMADYGKEGAAHERYKANVGELTETLAKIEAIKSGKQQPQPLAQPKPLTAEPVKPGEAPPAAAPEGFVKVPGENASAEDIASYHAAIGVPEDTSKYPALPEVDGHEFSEFDAQAWDGMAKPAFRDLGLTPQQVDGLGKLLGKTQKAAAAEHEKAFEAADARATAEGMKRIEGTYGKENASKMVGAANETIKRVFGSASKQVASARLPDGTLLGNYGPFIDSMIEIARAGEGEED